MCCIYVVIGVYVMFFYYVEYEWIVYVGSSCLYGYDGCGIWERFVEVSYGGSNSGW